MARKGRVDRGLYTKINAQGKLMWHVRLFHNGKGNKFGPFSTKTMARDFYEKCKREQREGQFFPERYHQNGYPLVVEWIDYYLTTLPGSTKKPKTQQEERRYAARWKKRLAGKRLHHITPSDVEAIKRQLVEQGYAPESIKHDLKFLRHVLNVAVRDGKLEKSPFIQVTMPKASQGKTRFLSMEEEARLIEALGKPYGTWARLAILTGLRKTELFSMRWADVDFDHGFLTLPHTKAGKVQYVPLNEEAQALLREFSSWECSTWVFPSQKPASHLGSYNFYGRVFLPAKKKAKLEDVTWHTLRHTFGARLAMNEHRDTTIATLLRHSGTALVQRYAHLSPTHLRAAVESVASYGKESTEGRKIVSEEPSTEEKGSVGIAPRIAPQTKAEKVENA